VHDLNVARVPAIASNMQTGPPLEKRLQMLRKASGGASCMKAMDPLLTGKHFAGADACGESASTLVRHGIGFTGAAKTRWRC
jgi:hypothetical protein